jgi:signal transduction histidine kinase
VTDLGALARRMVEQTGVRAEHPVIVDAPPLRLAVDSPKLERIIENLLVNAAKHTRRDRPSGSSFRVFLPAAEP